MPHFFITTTIEFIAEVLMRYKIKRIRSKRLARERALIFLCAYIFLLAFALTGAFSSGDLPDWMMATH